MTQILEVSIDQHVPPDPTIDLAHPSHPFVSDSIMEHAARAPHQVAVQCTDATYSYADLAKYVSSIACLLRHHGVNPGDIVGIYGRRGYDFVVGMLGTLQCGGVLLNLDEQLPVERRRTMIGASGCRIILDTSSATSDNRNRLEYSATRVVSLTDYSASLLLADAVGAAEMVGRPYPCPDDPAYLFFTSGSTGTPKGVLGCHKGLNHFLAWQRAEFNVGPGDRCAHLTGLAFDVVLRDVFLPLTSGATLYIPEITDNMSGEFVLPWMDRAKITRLHTVPSLASSWLATCPTGVSLDAVRSIFFAGEPLISALVTRWRERFPNSGEIVNLYGPTETTLAKCFYRIPTEISPGVQPVGWPMPDTQALVLKQADELCGVGEVGEIVIRTPFRSLGYINAGPDDSNRFTPNPFRSDTEDIVYHTGDRGRYRKDGALEILGRLDQQVKIRGVRVEPEEVNAVLARHPDVHNCVVIARQTDEGSPYLAAYVVSSSTSLDVNGLRNYLRAELLDAMIPQVFVQMCALPLNANGKVDRKALPEPDMLKEALYVAPSDPVQAALAQMFAEVLERNRIGVYDNFFSLGGHSLLVARLIARVRDTFQCELSFQEVFDAPTVHALASRVSVLQGASQPTLEASINAVCHNEPLPLSFAQESLWFLEQLEPNTAAYNIPLAFRLRGCLDIAVLEKSFAAIVERHESLRTCFPLSDGQPFQSINSSAPFTVQVHDARDLKLCTGSEYTQEWLSSNAHRVFDLEYGPLLRADLLWVDTQDFILLICVKHIVFDGWSLNVLANELTTFYTSLTNHEQPSLPPLPIQYADYAVWQRTWMQGPVLNEQIDYWKHQLAHAPILDLPTDFARPSTHSFRGGLRQRLLSPALIESIRALSQQDGVTLFMTVLSAFAAVLARYSAQEEIVIGSPIAGRMRTELEDLIGPFINTLALRVDLSNNPTFRELLQRVRKTTLEAYAHQDVPFEKLVQALQPERDRSRNPFFQVMLNTLEGSEPQIDLQSVEVSQIRLPRNTSKFDLTLELVEAADGTEMLLEYSTDLFTSDTADRVLGHVSTLLGGIVSNPDQKLSSLPLLTQPERERLSVEWNATHADLPIRVCLHQRIEDQVDRTPDAIALCFENEALTYSQLDKRANQLAHLLRHHGVGPDVLVGLCVERSIEMVVGLLGIMKAGGAYVPLDPSYPSERLAHIRDDAGISVVLTQHALLATLPSWDGTVLCLDSEWPTISLNSEHRPVSGVDPDNLAYVIYTSGSTGKPKGAMNSHRGICNRLLWMQHAYGLSSSDRVLQKTPYSFDVSVWEFFWPLMVGASLVVAAPELHRDAAGLVDLIRSSQITTLHFVPSMLQVFLDERSACECTSIRRVICSGEALPAAMVNQFGSVLPAELHNLYGPTEAAVDVSYWQCPTGGSVETVPIGRPVWNTQLYVLDRNLCLVPVGVPGELYLGGVQLARGYLKRPDLTAERFVPDPFSAQAGARLYKTGDLVKYLPDGNVEYLGRLDHQVKIRGFRIELGEIESALLSHAGVREAVVLAREDTPGDKRIVAYIVTNDGTVNVGVVRAYLQEKLPGYMVPAAFLHLDSLPLTPNGKVDRKALPAPDGSRPDLQEAYIAPTTSVEESLAEIWSQVLRLEQVGIHDNFFELGGDSILSIQIISRANQSGLRLTPRQIFEHQTIASLAAAAGTQPLPYSSQGIATGPAPLTPIQCWFFERALPEAHHYNQARLLTNRKQVSASDLERVCKSLAEHHDALRLRYHYTETGWRQAHALKEEHVFFSRMNLSSLSPSEQSSAITDACMQLQSSLDLSDGPLFRVAYFDLGPDQPGRIFLTIHHLVVDGVSWRVLLADLAAGLEQLQRGEAITLPPKTTSFQYWSQRLSEFAHSAELLQEKGYWLSEERSQAPGIPVDHPDGVNAIASQYCLEVSLSEAETRVLLQEVPAVYHTQINDVLLTALAQTLASWMGERMVLLDLEGHGREPLFDDADVSRTVGWFTSQFPVLLEVPAESDTGEALKTVKEQLRRIPHRGIGYGLLRYLCDDIELNQRLAKMPQAQVRFNYHGQLHQVLDDSDLFALAGESVGPDQSVMGHESHLLEVLGVIRQNRLRVSWIFSEQLYQKSTVERLAESFVDALRVIIAHCKSPEAGGFTPSDFPKARVSQAALDRLVAGIRKR